VLHRVVQLKFKYAKDIHGVAVLHHVLTQQLLQGVLSVMSALPRDMKRVQFRSAFHSVLVLSHQLGLLILFAMTIYAPDIFFSNIFRTGVRFESHFSLLFYSVSGDDQRQLTSSELLK
jgi:hypothetical protein